MGNCPKVSVIIPAHNGAEYLGAAIQSVLDQTYSLFELIVVDDASQDDTSMVVAQFMDYRLKYIALRQNRGASYARKTGLLASTGKIIFFLDQDDLFHPEKLALHVAYHEKFPHVGFTYNAYFNLNHSSSTIRDIRQPPHPVALADLVGGMPIPPSLWVVKRNWALLEELWDENTFFHGREIVFCSRLFMAGGEFAWVDEVLNYRRYHAGRVYDNLVAKCEAELTCQEIVFADPRCPDEVLALRDMASAKIYLLWAYLALFQEELSLGQDLLRKALQLRPNLLAGNPCQLTLFILTYSIDSENANHETILRRIFNQFPPELSHIADQIEWAEAQGYLLKGTRAVMWNRPEDGSKHFEQAMRRDAQLDRITIEMITAQLLDYEAAFGVDATDKVIHNLALCLEQIVSQDGVHSLKGNYSLNRVFQSYRNGAYKEVPRKVLQALMTDPKYLVDRGLLSILLRSTVHILTGSS